MTPHNEAKLGDIAKIVIMPGDPKRATYIAEHYLTDIELVNKVRGCFAYTGKYMGNYNLNTDEVYVQTIDEYWNYKLKKAPATAFAWDTTEREYYLRDNFGYSISLPYLDNNFKYYIDKGTAVLSDNPSVARHEVTVSGYVISNGKTYYEIVDSAKKGHAQVYFIQYADDRAGQIFSK